MKVCADKIWDTAYVLVLGLILLASIGMTVFSLKYGDNKVLILSDGKSYYIWLFADLCGYFLGVGVN